MKPESISVKRVISEKADKILACVQAAGHFICESDYTIKRKRYDSILLIYTISGRGCLKYRGKEFRAEKDCIFLIDCREPHVYFTDSSESWELAWIHFKGYEAFRQARYILESSGPLFSSKNLHKIQGILFNVLEMASETGLSTEIRISEHIHEIMHTLMMEVVKGEAAQDEVLPEVIEKAVGVLEENYSEDINLDKLAKTLFLNKYTLIRKFKNYIGMTPYTYLIKYRIKQSKSLLENTTLTVGEIAAASGFNDPSYYIKTFKVYEGITPLVYRKYWREGFH